MSVIPREISLTTARQLAITKQHLSGDDTLGMLDVIRNLGCMQLDPISVVARSHQLVLWSRLGNYDLADLDRLLWEERSLFEYWAHEASIVLTEDYPIHAYRMRHYPIGDSPWARRVRKWLETPGVNDLYRTMLARIHADGPVHSSVFKDMGMDFPAGAGWTSQYNAPRMIDYMWQRGEILVSQRQGIQRLWDISERCLPDWTPREIWDDRKVTRRAVQRAIRALGVATAKQIKDHYTRRRYPKLGPVLEELQNVGFIQPITVNGVSWNGKVYLHTEDLPLLETLEAGGFVPRTTLLSPFDNLICDRNRTEQLFDFHYRMEIYVPQTKRQYGYYVLPLLHGDRFIGRLDPKLDRKKKTLLINAVYAEVDAPDDAETVTAIRESIESLAQFVGGEEIIFGDVVPAGWRKLAKG